MTTIKVNTTQLLYICLVGVFIITIAAPSLSYADLLGKYKENPYKIEVKTQSRILYETMSEDEVKNLGIVRKGFGAIRSVQLVRKEVHEAVELCRKNVPEIGDKVKGQFDQWQSTVQPLLDRNKRMLEASVSNGFFKNPTKIKSFLEIVDKAALYDSKLNKTYPIGTKSSCKKLAKSLQDTEMRMANVLRNVEWPKPKLVFKPYRKPPAPVAHANETFEQAEKDAIK